MSELADGVDIRIIQLMLGHASIQQAQRYLNVTDEELRRGARRIASWTPLSRVRSTIDVMLLFAASNRVWVSAKGKKRAKSKIDARRRERPLQEPKVDDRANRQPESEH